MEKQKKFTLVKRIFSLFGIHSKPFSFFLLLVCLGSWLVAHLVSEGAEIDFLLAVCSVAVAFVYDSVMLQLAGSRTTYGRGKGVVTTYGSEKDVHIKC